MHRGGVGRCTIQHPSKPRLVKCFRPAWRSYLVGSHVGHALFLMPVECTLSPISSPMRFGKPFNPRETRRLSRISDPALIASSLSLEHASKRGSILERFGIFPFITPTRKQPRFSPPLFCHIPPKAQRTQPLITILPLCFV